VLDLSLDGAGLDDSIKAQAKRGPSRERKFFLPGLSIGLTIMAQPAGAFLCRRALLPE
jgi:hypothetical protein